MNNKYTFTNIIEHLSKKLENNDFVYAFWSEGSVPQGQDDDLSDLDLWLSIDDEKVFSIYHEIEKYLSEISEIDFKYIAKISGELGHVTYHLNGFGEFSTIDINTQAKSRVVYLVRDIDQAKVYFDKTGVVKFKKKQELLFDKDVEKAKLISFCEWMRPDVIKNIRRGKPLEAINYYQQIVLRYVEYLRLENGLSQKLDYGLKHVYRDLSGDADIIEHYYSVTTDDLPDKFDEFSKFIADL